MFVGATCFDKKLTAPREYHGKKFRIGPAEVIRPVKAAQFWMTARSLGWFVSTQFQIPGITGIVF